MSHRTTWLPSTAHSRLDQEVAAALTRPESRWPVTYSSLWRLVLYCESHPSSASIAAVCRSPSPWPPHRRVCEPRACRCNAGAIQVQCRCNAGAMQVQCGCNAGAMQVQCKCASRAPACAAAAHHPASPARAPRRCSPPQPAPARRAFPPGPPLEKRAPERSRLRPCRNRRTRWR